MKKIILSTLLAVCVALMGFAQDKKTEFGVQGGYSYNMPKGTDYDAVTGNSNGFHVGPVVNFNINEALAFHTGLLYNYFKSTQKIIIVLNNWTQYKTYTHQLDMPLRLQYSIPLADDLQVRLLAGPSLDFALNKYVNKEIVVDKKVVEKLTEKGDNLYSDHNTYSPLDLQFGIGVALHYYHFSVMAGYDWGLLDRNISTSYKFRANDIKLSIAYTF
ncbi:MAG: porin family protein [Paludibacteraceae bacterium]